MPTPDYVAAIRRAYGQGRLLLPGVSAVVVRTDLVPGSVHLLLTRRSDTGRWSLPSGIVEPFEQPAATMLRELYEETRVIAHVERLALLTTDPDVVYPNGDKCQFVAMCFRCQYVLARPRWAMKSPSRSPGLPRTSCLMILVRSSDAVFIAR